MVAGQNTSGGRWADEWIMLECNPAGQWLWLHHATDLPIPAAIADHLLTPT